MKDKDTHILEEKYITLSERRFRKPSSETIIDIILYDQENEIEVPFTVNYDIEETEMEGPYVFSQGGANINFMKSEEDVTLDDTTYPAGTDVSELFKYMDWWTDIPEKDEKYVLKFWQAIENKVTGDGDRIPVRKYPMTR